MKKFIIIISTLLSIIFIFFFIKYNVENNTSLFYKYKNKIPLNVKSEIRSFLTKVNNFYINNKREFKFEKRSKKILLNEDIPGDELTLFTNSNLIFTGPRAYFASNQEDLFLITGNGLLMSKPLKDISNNKKNLEFNKINTNLSSYLTNYKRGMFSTSKTSMIKSLLYKKNFLYVSLVEKDSDNCFKHSILKGKTGTKKIFFENFIKIDQCRIFYSDYVGGNLTNYGENKILYTVGDWAICEDSRWLKLGKGFCTKNNSQNMSSHLGKIYEIDLNSKDLKVISIGHDNPQGITFDSNRNIIYSTEHGPQGGDELNININPSIENIKNYGYPISSYGEHYGYPSEGVKYKYEEAPLYKSHKKYGFIEPIDYFVPSIGISDVEKIENKLFVASLGSDIKQGDLSFYIYTLDKNHKKIKKKEVYEIYERIRDIHILDDYALLFFETTGTIAVYKIDY